MTSLTLVRRIAARPSIVWDALTTPEGISCWWGPDAGPVLRAELDLRVGGHYRVRFRMLDGTEHETTGEYLEIEKPHRLLMSWRWLEGGGGPGDSRVEFRLRPIDEGTEFTLTHAQLPSDESARGHEWGWNGSLDKLRRHFSSPRGASARMSIPLLYAHPFSSYCQKAFIAFYEKDAPFELRLLSSDNPAAIEERHALWPLDRFPVLRADGRTIVESTIIIEWLDQRVPDPAPLIPPDPGAALEVRMLDRIFDNYVMTPMMTVVFDRTRPETMRDPYGVDRAHALLDKAYGWLDARMASLEWAAAGQFSLADCAAAPSLFYADWVHPLGGYPALAAYLGRLRARPSFARCVEDARPSRALFPGGAPPDRY